MNDTKAHDTNSATDWNEIHERLERVKSVIEQGWVPGPEEKKNILRQRARALAKEPEKKGAGEEIEIIEFLLAQERYAIDASHVREVYPLNDLTPVPCTPPFVLGIINVRGQIISVIDLKKLFGLPEKGLGDFNKVIILKSDAMEFGVLADVIVGFRLLRLAGLQQVIPTLTGVREEYLLGVTEDRLIVLDAEKILSDEKIVINGEPSEI
ncbi:MAG: chemotaxis protein CheW [Nitrospirota bacterium]